MKLSEAFQLVDAGPRRKRNEGKNRDRSGNRTDNGNGMVAERTGGMEMVERVTLKVKFPYAYGTLISLKD